MSIRGRMFNNQGPGASITYITDVITMESFGLDETDYYETLNSNILNSMVMINLLPTIMGSSPGELSEELLT